MGTLLPFALLAALQAPPSRAARACVTATLAQYLTQGSCSQNGFTYTFQSYTHVEFGGASVITSDDITVTPTPTGMMFTAAWQLPSIGGLEDVINITSQAEGQNAQSLQMGGPAFTGNGIVTVTDLVSYLGGEIGTLFLVYDSADQIVFVENPIAPTNLTVSSSISIGLNSQTDGTASLAAVVANFAN
ncbi:MAG TPA: hypothetical protein VGW33_15080 [Terriglobia bacterium]|nr:hypothetical protein [Terriglobia bacterium]